MGPGAERHREMITRRVDTLIDQLPSAGEVDFVQAFARPLLQQVIAAMLGFSRVRYPTAGGAGRGPGNAFRLRGGSLEPPDR